jgi:hypothetical protein
MPLHLEEHLDAATIVGSEIPEALPAPVEWEFDRPNDEWQPVATSISGLRPAVVDQLDDALRLTLDDSNRLDGMLRGGVSALLSD